MKRSENRDNLSFVSKPESEANMLLRKAELEYLSDLLPQMRNMAIGLGTPVLVYLLELAANEARLQLELELENLDN